MPTVVGTLEPDTGIGDLAELPVNPTKRECDYDVWPPRVRPRSDDRRHEVSVSGDKHHGLVAFECRRRKHA